MEMSLKWQVLICFSIQFWILVWGNPTGELLLIMMHHVSEFNERNDVRASSMTLKLFKKHNGFTNACLTTWRHWRDIAFNALQQRCLKFYLISAIKQETKPEAKVICLPKYIMTKIWKRRQQTCQANPYYWPFLTTFHHPLPLRPTLYLLVNRMHFVFETWSTSTPRIRLHAITIDFIVSRSFWMGDKWPSGNANRTGGMCCWWQYDHTKIPQNVFQ